MGNFDFSKLPRRWVDDIGQFLSCLSICSILLLSLDSLLTPLDFSFLFSTFGSSPMSAKLRGLIGVLRDVVPTVHHSTELVFELRLCFHAERV